MVYSILLLIIIILFMITDIAKKGFDISSPMLLFSFMQAISLLIQILSFILYGLKPKYEFNIWSFIIVLCSYLSFYFGTKLFEKGKIINNAIYSYNCIENKFSMAFYLTAATGIIGTFISLKNMMIFKNPLLFLLNNYDYFDMYFKTSSIGSILWLSNIAALFWYNFSKKKIIDKLLTIICFINIVFRAAYLYIIIGLFYFCIPQAILDKKANNKNILIYFIIIGILIISIPFISYSQVSIREGEYFIKIYPYTAGSFSNLAYYANSLILSGPENMHNARNISRDLGFGQIMIYIDKYLNTNFYQEPINSGFLNQIEGIEEEGNMSSIYLVVVKNPILIGMAMLFLLGALSSILRKYSINNLFFMSSLCFFSAANFLSFSGGGHFATTRFFPALLYIWPFIFLKMIIKTALSKNKLKYKYASNNL